MVEVVGQDGQTVARRHKEGVLAQDHVAVAVAVECRPESEFSAPKAIFFLNKVLQIIKYDIC